MFLFDIVPDLRLDEQALSWSHDRLVGSREPENTLEKLRLAVVDAFAIGGGCQLLLVVD